MVYIKAATGLLSIVFWIPFIIVGALLHACVWGLQVGWNGYDASVEWLSK